jgi:hypothetical protein
VRRLEALDGEVYRGDEIEQMIARLRAEPVPVRKRRPDLNIPETVEQVLLKGMAREPEQRYQSTPEFAEALAVAAAGGGRSPANGGVLGRLFGR